MRTAGKLGKLAAVRPHGLDDLAFYTRGHLAPPPPSVTVPTVQAWGMMGNDTLGDCTIAGVGHLILAANAETGAVDIVPSNDDIKKQYFAITGGQDSGAVELDVLRAWYTQGLFGDNKIAAFAPVRTSNILDVHSAVDLFGSCYIGVALPDSAQRQFADGKPWTITPQDQIAGGHCVLIVGYDQQYLYAVTWGQVQAISYVWAARYIDESWAVISQEFVETHSVLDIDALRKDISLLQS